MRFSFLFFITFLVVAGSSQHPLKTQVLVVGGGTGGIAAALQSARMGVPTLLVEQTPWLGGMLTSAGVSCTDGNDGLPGGMWQEFREALYQHYRARNLATGWVSNTCFEPAVGDSIFKGWAAQQKALTVLHGWYFEKALQKGPKVTGALFRNAAGEKLEVRAILTLDATELGDVFASAGAAFDLGMEEASYSGEAMAPGKNELLQDLTWVAVLKDYGPGADHTIARPENYDSTLYFCCCNEAVCPTGKPWNGNAFKMLQYGKLPGGKYMINWPAHGNDFYANVVGLPPWQREEALADARRKTLGFLYFLQTQLGLKQYGFYNEFGTTHQMAWMPYHREGRRVKGISRLNVNHLIQPYANAGKLYQTGIAVGDYPIDHHHAPEKKAPVIAFPPVPSFSVPLGCLIPERVEGLIVCDKGISVSNLVNGSTRLQPCVLLTGQAAGVLAALCIRQNVQPASMDVRAVQSVLLDAKAYIQPIADLLPEDSAWQAIQKIAALGLLQTVGKPRGWANKTFFYPDSLVDENEWLQGLKQFEPRFVKEVGQSSAPLTIARAVEMIAEVQWLMQISHRVKRRKKHSSSAEKMSTTGMPASGDETPLTRRQLAILVDQLAPEWFGKPLYLPALKTP